MRTFLNAFLDAEIVVHTVDTHRPRGGAPPIGTLVSVDDTTLRLRTPLGDRYVALAQLVAFRPRDSSKVAADPKAPMGKTEVLELWGAVQKALKDRKPEAEIRPMLGRVIRGAERLLAKRDDGELAVARERAQVILSKCSDPTLPPEE